MLSTLHQPIARAFHISALVVFTSSLAVAELPFVKQGRAGFVVSDIEYALAPKADPAESCPAGFSLQLEEVFSRTREGKRRGNESEEEYSARLAQGARELSTAANGQNLCMHPEAGSPDPFFKTVSASPGPVQGIDIDGRQDPDDFQGEAGAPGVDNQFYRLVGCSRGFQSTGQSNDYALEMLAGSWGILLSFEGVDDLHNDDYIEVGFYANADPIQLSPARVPLAYATYAMDQDRRFRGHTTGRIENGVIITEPTDVLFRSVVNSMRLERPLLEARLQGTISQDGVLTGVLAGFTPVEALYDVQYGYRNGKNGAGELAPLALRSGSANGAARVLGYTCQGAYHAIHRLADGHPDPQSGRYTSLSTQYNLEAIPAFVVDTETRSGNATLDVKAEFRNEY